MKNSRLVLSDQAVADIVEQSDWYGEQPAVIWRHAGRKRSPLHCFGPCRMQTSARNAIFGVKNFAMSDERRLPDFPNTLSSTNSKGQKYSSFECFMAPVICKTYFRVRGVFRSDLEI